MKNTQTINQRLLEIIEKDFDGCEWFIIAANDLMGTLNETIEMFRDENTTFSTIKNSIGKVGIGIGNVERCLEGVEDFYSKAVEILSAEAQKNKDSH
jgi:uncharacterized protein YerC